MPCTPFQFAGGRGILCTRTARPRCACGTSATLQCDAPSGRRSGTCDRHLCAACATEVGPDRHLCPGHAEPLLTQARQIVERRRQHNVSGQDAPDLSSILAALAASCFPAASEPPKTDMPQQVELF